MRTDNMCFTSYFDRKLMIIRYCLEEWNSCHSLLSAQLVCQLVRGGLRSCFGKLCPSPSRSQVWISTRTVVGKNRTPCLVIRSPGIPRFLVSGQPESFCLLTARRVNKPLKQPLKIKGAEVHFQTVDMTAGHHPWGNAYGHIPITSWTSGSEDDIHAISLCILVICLHSIGKPLGFTCGEATSVWNRIPY